MKRKIVKNSHLNQAGSIMMITLILLLLSTVIGFIAIKTATTGMSIAGNYKSGMQAFYTTDSVTKYVIANPTTFDMNLYPGGTLTALNFSDPGFNSVSSVINAIFPTSSTLSSTVTYLQTGLPPAGTSSKYFQTNYFLVKTAVKGTNNTQEVQDTIYASTVPKMCGQSC
jgi:hypothetical protein